MVICDIKLYGLFPLAGLRSFLANYRSSHTNSGRSV